MVKHLVVLISGKQGSGKSSLADSLQNEMQTLGFATYRTRFAKVLYMMHDAVRDIGRKYGIDFPDKNGPLLQYLGTEVVRNNFGEDSWVNCLRKELSLLFGKFVILIDDCRFPNEVAAFDNDPNFDVLKVRLDADRDVRKSRTNAWRDNDTHPSEVGLDGYMDFDLFVRTDALSKAETLKTVTNEILKRNELR